MNQNKQIKLYAVSTCGHCNTLKTLFQSEGIIFDSVDVDLLEGKQRRLALEEVRKINQRCSFPTTVVDDTVIVGYRENEIKEALEL